MHAEQLPLPCQVSPRQTRLLRLAASMLVTAMAVACTSAAPPRNSPGRDFAQYRTLPHYRAFAVTGGTLDAVNYASGWSEEKASVEAAVDEALSECNRFRDAASQPACQLYAIGDLVVAGTDAAQLPSQVRLCAQRDDSTNGRPQCCRMCRAALGNFGASTGRCRRTCSQPEHGDPIAGSQRIIGWSIHAVSADPIAHSVQPGGSRAGSGTNLAISSPCRCACPSGSRERLPHCRHSRSACQGGRDWQVAGLAADPPG